MKSFAVAAILISASSISALAESCHEKFVRLMVDGNGAEPAKIHVTQEIKGGATSINYFYQAGDGHWMTEMIEPANQDWVLTYDNTMFTSSDKGTSWKKLRTLDGGQPDAARKNREENATTTKNAACGAEDLNGVAHETVEADFETLQNFKTENHYKYWVNRETGKITKATYQMKGSGFESFTTQLIEPAPGLELPTPK